MARKREFTEETVLLRAMNLFWEKGYHATSMETLVSTLGINRASMYNLFGSKYKLYNIAIQQYMTIKIAKIEEVFKAQKNVRKGIYELFDKLLIEDKNEIRGCFIVNSITELENKDSELNNLLKGYEQEVITKLLTYLKEGISQGQISPYKNIETIARTLNYLEKGFQVAIKRGEEKEELMKSVGLTLSILN